MSHLKNTFIYLTVLAACTSYAEIAETDSAFKVSGNSYCLEFDKSDGSIKSIICNDAETSLKSSDNALWEMSFADGKIITSKGAKFDGKIENGELVLQYAGADADVCVKVKDGKDFADFHAQATPKSGDMMTFQIPSSLIFAPEKLGALTMHNSIPRNSGLSLNGNFFKDRSLLKNKNDVWCRGENAGSGAYKKIFSSDLVMVPKFRDFFQLSEGKDAKEWLGASLAKKLASQKAQATRTFAKSVADIELADSPNGVFFGGKTIDGKGAVFRIGGWFGNGREHDPSEYISAAIKHAKKISAGTKRDRVLVLNFPTNGVSSRIKLATWKHILGRSGAKIESVHNIDSLQEALKDDTVLAIVNPYEELCPVPQNCPLPLFAEQIRNFAANGGYWFETGGFSFFIEMSPMKFLRVHGEVPAACGDFFHFNLAKKNLAIYAVQPIQWNEWAAEKDSSKMFIPSSFELQGTQNGGKLTRKFMYYAKRSERVKIPQVRIAFDIDKLESADRFCLDNGVKKTFEQKMPKELAEKFKQCVLYKSSGATFGELQEVTDRLPSPCIVHNPNYLKGGFDKEYPDHVPPRIGTPEEFKTYIAHVKQRGDFFMPYTNNTWWCDNPKGPTFEKHGDVALSLDINRKPYHEIYGKNDGWTITMWHPAVKAANAKLLNDFTKDYPSDFIFQDQSGARSSRYDFNAASPTPNAYIEGMISTVRQDAKKAYLSTEDGWYGIADWEIQFSGMSFGFMQEIGWANLLWNDIPQDAFNLDNIVGAMFHDKVSLIHHNLGSSVNNPRDMAMTLGYGFSMINWATKHMLEDWKWYPDWIKWVDRVQKSIASKYVGKKMISFKHTWEDDSAANGNSVFKSKYGDVSITANTGDKPVKARKVTIGKNGFYATAPDTIAAANIVKIGRKKIPPSTFATEKIGDKTYLWLYGEPDSDVYFQLFKDIKALKLKDGTLVDVASEDKIGKLRMPAAAGSPAMFMEFECIAR